MSDYIAVNRANWDSRVPHHVAGYGLEQFREDPGHLSGVVAFDRPRLGTIDGLDVVHLQCHIGTDTLSLARLGAGSVTGLDFSPPALEAAARLASDCGTAIEYVESELYDAAGCPTSDGGPRWSPPSSDRVAGCSSGRAIRCCGR